MRNGIYTAASESGNKFVINGRYWGCFAARLTSRIGVRRLLEGYELDHRPMTTPRADWLLTAALAQYPTRKRDTRAAT